MDDETKKEIEKAVAESVDKKMRAYMTTVMDALDSALSWPASSFLGKVKTALRNKGLL